MLYFDTSNYRKLDGEITKNLYHPTNTELASIENIAWTLLQKFKTSNVKKVHETFVKTIT